MAELAHLQSTLDQKRQELARLEAELKAAQRDRLAHLAADHGFKDTDALIFALSEHASPALKAAIDQQRHSEGEQHPPDRRGKGRLGRKKRVLISPALREKIVAEVERGTMIAADIAAKFGVSASTVNQIKQRNGLTKKRRSR